MGLVRTLVATGVLGLTYLGNTYTSTNLMSNLLFDLFAGGALAAVLVPALSAALVGDDPEEAQRCASAFANTSWTARFAASSTGAAATRTTSRPARIPSTRSTRARAITRTWTSIRSDTRLLNRSDGSLSRGWHRRAGCARAAGAPGTHTAE